MGISIRNAELEKDWTIANQKGSWNGNERKNALMVPKTKTDVRKKKTIAQKIQKVMGDRKKGNRDQCKEFEDEPREQKSENK
ncbi:6226_t:CDS:2, partial [Gigaspora margarita]